MPADARQKTAARRQRLIHRRKALGLTQEDLAELLAVGRTTVVRWERGHGEPLPWIRPKLARALRVSAERLENLLASPDHGGLAGTGVPRQLPAAVADFTGRSAELQALTQMLDQASDGVPGTVVISAIGGMAGVGKTAVTLHWAHQAALRFPDGQLYVNLRGFDPAGSPVTAAEAIRGFLDALGMAPERLPADPEAQAGLYRSLLAQRQMLIVLDNARDEQQVRPLLPASPGTLVLVTSRNQLVGLAAADGARLLSLDCLTHDEAAQLLSARIGQARATAEPEAVAEIAGLCGRLPLALTAAAAGAVIRARLSLAAIATELRDNPARLDALDSGDPAASVRAVFSWSYQQLSPGAARMFWLLGLHPGPDITAPGAASLAAIPLDHARRDLAELTRAHLVSEHATGRYAFHDLLRAYAAELAVATNPDEVRRTALARVLDHYLHTAYAAARRINPALEAIPLAPARSGVRPESLTQHGQALGWFEAEHQVLLAAIILADSRGFDVHAWQIPSTMLDFFNYRGRWHDMVAIQRIALAAATRLRDTAGLAVSRRELAGACARVGDYDQARDHLGQCLQLYQQLGDRRGQAKVYAWLEFVALEQTRYAEALGNGEQALRLFQGVGDAAGEARMLNNVGWAHALLGDYQQARAFAQQALSMNAELGLELFEAYTWATLGYAEYHLYNIVRAAFCYQRALRLSRNLGDLPKEADTLAHLGDIYQAAGKLNQAREAWQQAVDIFDHLHHPDADEVRAKLASTTAQAARRSAESR